MRTLKLRIAGGLLGVLLPGLGIAQAATAADLYQPTPADASVSATDGIYSYTALPEPKAAEPPAPPSAAKPAKAGEAKADDKKADEKKDEKADEAKPEEEEAWKLFKSPCLDAHRIDIRGWLDQGFTWNPQNPANGFNGPVGYNDRANEYQLNQLYLIAERTTKTDGCGVDVGGRLDLLYGTDRRFVTATELDSDWNSSRFYGLAMPQMYGDLAINNLTIRAGHFLAPVGYESVMAPENFFYSHSYQFLYAQPTTLSGGELMYKLNDRWTVNSGIDTGWNDWTAPNGKVNYFGGGNWTSEDEKTTLAFEMFLGNTNPTPGLDSDRIEYCLVLTQKIGEKWRYALEHNFGHETNSNGSINGDWYGLSNYLFYDLNDCWSFGGRYEWMFDQDATVIAQVGPPPAGPYAGSFNEFALGTNYKPNKNVLLRSEVRWDWSKATDAAGNYAFDNGTKDHQFLWGTDLIVRF